MAVKTDGLRIAMKGIVARRVGLCVREYIQGEAKNLDGRNGSVSRRKLSSILDTVSLRRL